MHAMGKASAKLPHQKEIFILKSCISLRMSLRTPPSFGKIEIAKQACCRQTFKTALQLSVVRWSEPSSEQADVSAARALRRLSADEFLDELLGGKLFFLA